VKVFLGHNSMFWVLETKQKLCEKRCNDQSYAVIKVTYISS